MILDGKKEKLTDTGFSGLIFPSGYLDKVFSERYLVFLGQLVLVAFLLDIGSD
jgi:hypothetical protein